jgi:excisionase family DNA binding protein
VNEQEERKHFSITEAAAVAQVTRELLYRAIEYGALKIWRPWERANPRIYKEDLEEWMRSSRSPAVHDQHHSLDDLPRVP